jgi:hypothetical protein
MQNEKTGGPQPMIGASGVRSLINNRFEDEDEEDWKKAAAGVLNPFKPS